MAKYDWFVAEKIPESGALGMSLVGAMGMFSSAIFQPVIGGWVDSATEQQEALSLTGNELQLAVGQTALTNMLLFPGILISFYHLYFWKKRPKQLKHKKNSSKEGFFKKSSFISAMIKNTIQSKK